jgi:hypothetical protein
MLPQIETIWRLTRNMPPERQVLFANLFSEIEHANQKTSTLSPATPQLEFSFNSTQSNYYEPKWFYNSTNGQIQ